MWQYFFSIDVALLQCINAMGSPAADAFWVFVTKTQHWIPFFALLLWVVYRAYPLPAFWRVFGFALASLLCSVLIMSVCKELVQRPRPIYDEQIAHLFRKVIDTSGYSFFSGHTSNSFAVCTFVYLVLRAKTYAFWVYAWAVPFALSRLYLAVHFPSDILVGFLVGNTCAFLAYFLCKKGFKF